MQTPELLTTLQDRTTVQQLLPIWTDWGIADQGVAIHSLGISFLTLLGQQLGYMAISEFPAPREGIYAQIGDDIRSDTLWFDRQTRQPVLIAEFERYSGVLDQIKLESKVSNLLLAHHRCTETAQWLVLAYWTKGLVSLPDFKRFEQIVRRGFTTDLKQLVCGTQQGSLICLQFLHQVKSPQSLYLDRILITGER